MYLPISNGGSIRCPTAADAAAVSLTQVLLESIGIVYLIIVSLKL